MSIDEAIEHAREVAEYKKKCNKNSDYIDIECERCAEEHEQLAEWLEDYKRIKMLIPLDQALKAEYNKAIDDFAEKMKYEYGSNEIHETIDEIAEQLKAGGENDKSI